MKQFLRYILTLVAIFIATTNIWADCVIFSDGGSYEVMNGLSQRKEKNFTNIPALPAGLLTFTYSASGAAIGGVDVTATYSDGTSEKILSSSTGSNPSYNFNGKIVTKLTFKGTSGTLKKTISNVKLTRHTSISASTISPFPLTAVGSTSNAQTVTITYSNIGNNYSITSTNTNDFSISPLPFTYDKCGGEMQFAITFHPQGTTGGARSGSFTIAGDGNGKSNNNTSVTINVSGTAKGFPEFTWKGNTQYYVDESLDLSNLWTTTSNETTPKYSIKRFTSTDTFGSADPHFTDGTNTTILLSKEGELVLQMHQDASTTYSPLTKEVTITIVKRPTDFSLNFANEYFVDDEINKSTFFTNATNSEVAVQVSDKTADNRALFTYNGSILKANGAILNADAETTTITVTQPETYKWTGKTLPKEVIVKKYPTDFNWLLQNTYYVGETITSIFTKTNNSLPSTITSSDPTIVKVENNQLIALRAGKVRITVSQAVDRKWVAFTHEKEITIIKRNTNFQLLLGTTYYVDDRIAKSNIYSKANENPLPVSIVSSNPNILEYDATTQQLIAHNAGKATITVSQAKDTTWTDFNQSLEVTILKHNIVATINPNNAVWNDLVTNPFAATSTHPVSGQVTPIDNDNFNVEQQGNEHIALMDANTRNIQTYYTNGTVDFLITRPEDRKYDALNQTLTLTVNANENGCTLFSDPTHYKIGMYENSNGVDFTLPGIGDVLTFQLWKNTAATQDVHVYGYNAAGTQVLDKKYENSSITTNENNPNNCSVQLSEDIVKIKIKAGGTLNKHFKNLNITRAQYIRPTEGERALSSTDTLVLPPVAINLPRSKPFNLEWSACSDIKITCDNPKFTISTTDISAVSGSQNITITCNTSEIGTFIGDVTIYNQEQKETFPVICEVYTKWLTDSISGSATHSMKVDDSWDTDFYFPIQRASKYPTTDGAFHYAIEHTFVDADPADRNPNHPNEVISYNDGVITAHNAGTAILTIKHDETDEHFESQQFTCTLTVSKHDVELQWKDPVYFNDTISNYFTTTNTASSIVIESQTDTDVAKLTDEFNPTSNNSLDLITYNKEASTTVTVSQVETYYWNGYSIPHTITPIDQNNHVTFTLTQENYISAFKHSFVDPAANDQSKGPDWQSGGIYFGGEGAFEGAEGWNWDEKYYIIQFTGIPDSIYFDASRSGAATGTIKLSVSEGKTPDNLTEVWSNSNNSENNKIIRKLNPDSRYLKFSYTGNLWGLFKNITVTELNEFRAVDSQDKTLDKDTLDFGANQVYRNKTRTFELRYANPGYKITVESTNPKFTVTPDFIGDIGGEYHGTRTITISYTSTVPDTISGEDMIIINDEIGHTDTIRLYASSYKAEQVLHWRDDFEKIPQPIIRRKNGDITDAAWATSQLPVTYTSSNENVIKISDDGTTLIPVAEGEAEITAYQLGNEMWLPADPITKTFIVTDKLLQYIVWDDDLTNIIKEDITPQTLTLTAQVYLQKEDGTVVFSPEQTNNLKYQSGNDNIVSAVGSTLTIHNVGRTTLTATVEGNNDYATASMTKTVIVRSATPGCDDNLLYHHEGDPIQFFQYNLDEIIKEPIALDRSKGEAGYVIVSHYGQSWNLAIQYYYAEIRVEQSLDNCSTWSTVETIKPVKNQENIDSIPLSRQATHIRFVRNNGGQGYQFLYNIDVHPAQYIEAQDVVDFGEIHVGSRETRTFPLHYSNIKHSLSPVPSTSEVTATPNTFGECSGFGTQDISVTWLPTQVSDNATATITFTDPNSGMKKEVTLVAKVFKGTQNIIWDNRPTIIEDCGSILFPEKTTANLSITWTVIQGNEYADFNEQGMLELYKNGTITVQATQEGTANYEPLTPVQYTFVIQLQTIFVGTEDSDWHNPNNWTMCRLPYPTEVVTMEHPATLSTHATVAGVIFSTNGSIHITHTGGLTINEAGVTNAATNGSSIIIDNNPQGAGFLLISPSAPETNKYPYFTMNFTTRAFNEGVPRDETWQYMGAPGNNATFKNLDSQTLIYHWDETKGWTSYAVNGILPTWQGYALTQSIKTNHTYNITAQAMQGSQTINLTRTEEGMKGDNLFVNSFTAPIDITKIDPTTDVTGDWDYQTFYLFNTGSWNDWQGVNPDHKHDDASSPGHYYTIPILSAQYLDDAQTVIPPMQGVYVHTEAPATITLDYSKHVWNGTPDNTPMRAPQKQTPDFRRIRIQASSQNSGADRMYIIQESSTTRGYDNGYDGKNINAKGQVNIYTNEPFGKMEVSCANNIDSMYIGFRAGSDSQYQLTFGSLVGDSLYLKDLNDNTIIRMEEGGMYHFFAEPNSVNHSRFQILLHPSEVAGDNTTTGDHQVCQAKIWIDNQYLYITDAPIASQAIIYAISGQRVASYTVNNSYYTIPLSSLNSGIYILQINNQRYKFVWK